MSAASVTAVTTASVELGCWTILDEGDDTVRATVTRERDRFTVRDAGGRVLGRYATPRQALSSLGV
jgi:hypothetical protein